MRRGREQWRQWQDELRAAIVDLLYAPLDLDGPSALNLVALKKAGNQTVRKLRTRLRRKLTPSF